jgi:tRNA A37 threonylcarbamoyladenosine dehydratase
MSEQDTFYDEAFQRNIGILTQKKQHTIKNATIAIAGLGGVGGVHATTLVRTGFTKFRIADFDTYSLVNFNRQAGATMDTLGKSKGESIKNMILAINPYAEVTLFDEGLTESNVDQFLDGVDVAIDGIDFFCIEPRRLLFRKAKEKGIYAITSGPIAYGACVLIFDPKGLGFDDYMNITDDLPLQKKLYFFGLGITPSLLQASYFRPESLNWDEGHYRAPSLCVGTLLSANLVGVETIKLVTGELGRVRFVPHSLHFDPYVQKLRNVWMPYGNKNPIQKIKFFILNYIVKKKNKKR